MTTTTRRQPPSKDMLDALRRVLPAGSRIFMIHHATTKAGNPRVTAFVVTTDRDGMPSVRNINSIFEQTRLGRMPRAGRGVTLTVPAPFALSAAVSRLGGILYPDGFTGPHGEHIVNGSTAFTQSLV